MNELKNKQELFRFLETLGFQQCATNVPNIYDFIRQGEEVYEIALYYGGNNAFLSTVRFRDSKLKSALDTLNKAVKEIAEEDYYTQYASVDWRKNKIKFSDDPVIRNADWRNKEDWYKCFEQLNWNIQNKTAPLE